MSDKDFCNDIVALIKGVDEQRELMSNVSEKWFHKMYRFLKIVGLIKGVDER
jgi:hypothetical protein